MKSLQLPNEYRSLSALNWDDIPQLAILTGMNGVGKTQFLALLAACSGAVEPDGFLAVVAPPMKIEPEPTFAGYLPALWTLTNTRVAHEFFTPVNELMRVFEGPSRTPTSFEEYWSALERRFEAAAILENPITARLIKSLREGGSLDHTISRSDVLAHLGTYDLVTRNSSQPLATLTQVFYSYVNARVTAHLRGESRDEIEHRLGRPPWDRTNDLLQSFEMRFRVTSPDDLRFAYELQCCFPEGNVIIPPSELSSGEQAVLALVSLVVTTSILDPAPPGAEPRTDLLLLDEPDAHLNTSKIKSYLEHIHQLTERGVQIIMVTHRPDTLALAPEGSLFEMKREGNRTLIDKVTSRDELIGRLAADTIAVLPGVRIVLVEDENDRQFHQWAYDRALKLRQLPSTPRLVFMPVVARGTGGKGGGGKSAVIKRLDGIQREGLAAVHRGLVDGDNDTQSPPPGVVRLRRYTLENYLADPIALYCAVVSCTSIDEELHFSSEGGVNLGELGLLRTFDRDTLQRIANVVIVRMEQSAKLNRRTRCLIELHSENGVLQLEYPQWIFDTNKDALRAAINETLGSKILKDEHMHSGPERAGLIPKDLAEAYYCLITNRHQEES